MQQGFVATYRGVSYPANIGPGNGDVVLFSDTEPPADHGFEHGAAYWRKQVARTEITSLEYVRTVGVYRGERCLLLGDRGDRLHIAYLGHDAPHAEELGYWMVDRGAYEVVVARGEVGDIMAERVPHPAGRPAPGPVTISAALPALDAGGPPSGGHDIPQVPSGGYDIPQVPSGGHEIPRPPADRPVAFGEPQRARAEQPATDVPVARGTAEADVSDDHLVSDDMVGDDAIPSWDRPEPADPRRPVAERQAVAAMNGHGPGPQHVDVYASPATPRPGFPSGPNPALPDPSGYAPGAPAGPGDGPRAGLAGEPAPEPAHGGPNTTPFPGAGPMPDDEPASHDPGRTGWADAAQVGRLGEMVEDTAGALAGPRNMPSGGQPVQPHRPGTPEPGDDGSWRAPPADAARASWAADPLSAPTPEQISERYAADLPAWARDSDQPRHAGEAADDPNLQALHDLGRPRAEPLESTQMWTPTWDDDPAPARTEEPQGWTTPEQISERYAADLPAWARDSDQPRHAGDGMDDPNLQALHDLGQQQADPQPADSTQMWTPTWDDDPAVHRPGAASAHPAPDPTTPDASGAYPAPGMDGTLASGPGASGAYPVPGPDGTPIPGPGASDGRLGAPAPGFGAGPDGATPRDLPFPGPGADGAAFGGPGTDGPTFPGADGQGYPGTGPASYPGPGGTGGSAFPASGAPGPDGGPGTDRSAFAAPGIDAGHPPAPNGLGPDTGVDPARAQGQDGFDPNPGTPRPDGPRGYDPNPGGPGGLPGRDLGAPVPGFDPASGPNAAPDPDPNQGGPVPGFDRGLGGLGPDAAPGADANRGGPVPGFDPNPGGPAAGHGFDASPDGLVPGFDRGRGPGPDDVPGYDPAGGPGAVPAFDPALGSPGAGAAPADAAGVEAPPAGRPVPADPERSPRTTDSWAFDPDTGTVHRAPAAPAPDAGATATFERPSGHRPPVGWEDAQPVAYGAREPEPDAEPEDRSRISPRWTFTDLVTRAGIPDGEYAVEEEVDGAFCLITADDGFDVFYSEHGARHNLQHFDDEQAAFYYLFGRLSAVALRSGRLAPPR